MSRTIAIIITAVTAMLCGIPALGLMCFGAYMAATTKIPALMESNSGSTPEGTLLIGLMIVLLGLSILLLVAGVGFFSIRFSRPADASEEPLPLP